MARAYDDLGFTVHAKKAWTDVEAYHDFAYGDKKAVELKIVPLFVLSTRNRLEAFQQGFLDLALKIKPRSGFKRKAFTAACKVINRRKTWNSR